MQICHIHQEEAPTAEDLTTAVHHTDRHTDHQDQAHQDAYAQDIFPVQHATGITTGISQDMSMPIMISGKAAALCACLCCYFISPFFIAIVGMASETFRVPQRLSTDYDTSLVISDYINVLGDTKALENSMMAFYDETGITPAVFTVYNEDWQDNYSSLENYSYDLYVNAFDDEKHWLIVYSQPQEPDENFNDWYWEGMQGDDTSDILTSAKADGFNSDLQRYLTDKSISVADAISRAFDNLTPKIMKKSVDTSMLFPFLFFGGFILIHAYFMVFHDPSRKYRNAEVCPENAPVGAQSRSVQTEQTVQPPAPAAHEESCPYCGGSYVPGRDKRCPYCQSLLDYSHDTNE